MKTCKRFLMITMMMCLTAMLGGCSYVNNKSWDDLSAQERQEARQEFEEAKKELEKEHSGDSAEDKFAVGILEAVERALEEEE